jgi:UPF0755 protein
MADIAFDFLRRWKWTIVSAGASILLVAGFALWDGLSPVSPTKSGEQVTFTVVRGQGFFEVAKALDAAHLLRSRMAFETLAFLSGAAFHVQPGIYHLSSVMSGAAMLREFSSGAPTVAVTIVEGLNIYEIDKTLADADIIARGGLINFKSDGDLEGKLFPDTYQFFEGSDISVVVQKFLDNFNAKAAPLFPADQKKSEQDLTLASIIEQEAPDLADQSIIAGIILKRIADGMRLQIDATVCYAEQITLPSKIVDCSALTRVDFSPDSPYNSNYNTYLHAGLPPGPIGNPGIAAINAALHPTNSPYVYYISDLATGKIIYATTLAEQEANIKKYLRE